MDEKRLENREVERLWLALRDDLLKQGAGLHGAEDIAQETWLIAARRPPSDHGRVRGWLYVVGTRLLGRTRQREGLRVHAELQASRSEPSSTVGEPSGANEGDLPILKWLEELPEHHGVALRLRFIEELEVEEIARHLGVSKWTVHSRIQRGVARLRARIEARGEERGGRGRLQGWILALRSLPSWGKTSTARRGLAFAIACLALLSTLPFWTSSSRRHALLPEESGPSVSQLSATLLLAEPSTQRTPVADSVAPSPAVDPGLRLAGTVRSPGGAPAAGAIVHSIVADGSRPESTVVSDALGRYAIGAQGDLVWASHEGWCESARCYLPSVVVSAGLDLVLGPKACMVSIQVETDEGLPVPGASLIVDVRAKSEQVLTSRGTLEYSAVPPRALTDAQGRARLQLPDATPVDLTVVAPGLPYWNEVVVLPASHELKVRLPPPLSLSGTCVDESGLPLWKARVEVRQHYGLIVRSGETDNDGRFSIGGLAPGVFVLVALEHDGVRSKRKEGRTPEGLAPLRLELSEAQSMYGRVVRGGVPRAGVEVSLAPASQRPGDGDHWVTRTDREGRFVFPGCRDSVHEIRIPLQESRQSYFRLGPVRAWEGEHLCVLPEEGGDLAPLEVRYSAGSGPAPRLVEFRSQTSGFSVTADADAPGSRHFRAASLPSDEYMVVGWHPDLGTFMELVQHRSGAPCVHDLNVPAVGTLLVEVDLPAGVRPEQVEVSAKVPAFNRFGLGATSSFWGGSTTTRRLLAWSEEHGAFVGTLPLGSNEVYLRGEGLADDMRQVTVYRDPTRLLLRAQRAVELTVFFRHVRPGRLSLDEGELVRLECLTPTGVVEPQMVSNLIMGHGNWVGHEGFERTLRIPATTFELHAQTRPSNPKRVGNPIREGVRKLEPGELEGTSGRPRLEILLHEVPR